MEEVSISRYDDFMKMVEAGVPYVYSEHPSPRQALLRTSPLIIGMILTFSIPLLSLFIPGLSLGFWVFVSPLLIGMILVILIMIHNFWRMIKQGLKISTFILFSRVQLSGAISFLDMILMGYEKTGEIPRGSRPIELKFAHIRSLGAAVGIINKIDPESGIKWENKIEEELGKEIPRRSKLTKATYILTIVIAIVSVYYIGSLMGFYELDPFFGFILNISYIIIFFGYLFIVTRVKEIGAPEGLIEALEKPDVKELTAEVLQSMIRVIKNKCNYPIRVFIIGDYNELRYVDHTIKTSTGITLRAAVLLPSEIKS